MVPMITKRLKRILLVAIGLGIMGLAILAIRRFSPVKQQVFRVDQVWGNASDLVGRRITVEGPADFEIWMTAVLCCPPSCDCNETYGFVSLVSEGDIRYNSEHSYRDDIGISFDGSGNECSMKCAPFDPQHVERLRITGILLAQWVDWKIAGLPLTDIDFSASYQFVNGEWRGIPTGSFTIPLATVTPHPNACTPRP